jgi:hypothetical protein
MTVDLSTLKVGDQVIFRNRKIDKVLSIRKNIDYILYLENEREEIYYEGGSYTKSDKSPWDIVEIIPQTIITGVKTNSIGTHVFYTGTPPTQTQIDEYIKTEGLVAHKIEEEEEDKPYSDEYIEYIKSRPPYGTCVGEGLKQWIGEDNNTLVTKMIKESNKDANVDTNLIKEVLSNSYNSATAKTDTGKDRLDLLPYAGLASAAKAFEYGLGEYGHNNYQNAKSYRPFLAAAYRHLAKKLDGEDLDKDSGLGHISHSLACLLMAEQLKAQGKPMNDIDTMKPYGVRNKPKE